jgi:rubrerythrin
MLSLVHIAGLDLRGAFDFAIMIEEDAQIRYEQLARLVGDDPGGAGDVFRIMAANEGKHRSQLVTRRDSLFRDDPQRVEISLIGEGVERPDVDDEELPRTAREALELALAAEKRAHAFYEDVSPRVKDPAVRALFEGLMQDEAGHAALLAAKIAQLDASEARGEEQLPCPHHVAAPVPVETYPDRSVVQTVVRRFDAGTQAVVVGVVLEQKTPEEVASELGVSRRTVAWKLKRFLEIVRDI